MNTSIGVDFGGTSVKPGVVRGGVILEKGNVIPTIQDGNVDALIGAIVAEINR
jgi:predicted NBD/HSP70 family sugar kinase